MVGEHRICHTGPLVGVSPVPGRAGWRGGRGLGSRCRHLSSRRVDATCVRGAGGEARAFARASHLRRGRWSCLACLCGSDIRVLRDPWGRGVGPCEGSRVPARALGPTDIAGVAKSVFRGSRAAPRGAAALRTERRVWGRGGRPSPVRAYWLLVCYRHEFVCVVVTLI